MLKKDKKFSDWEPTIGLEVHVQLSLKTKMFCRCESSYGKEPNTLTCPVCLGLPGALPTINEKAIDMAIKLGCALNCSFNKQTSFSRKNYYYPDLPKGYQISQYEDPICKDGFINLNSFEGSEDSHKVRIVRAHLEEDSGKLVHLGEDSSIIDFNRSGIPLIEVVSAPDISSSNQAKCYLVQLKQIIQYVGISDCDMEKGNFRIDLNVSVKRKTDKEMGTRREVKNLNSFKAVEKAIEYEFYNQIKIIGEGKEIKQSTMTWDEEEGKTVLMRTKEEAQDYRYFPEPDLPRLILDDDKIDAIRNNLPDLPNAKIKKFKEKYKLKKEDIKILTSNISLAKYYESMVDLTSSPQRTASWIIVEVLHYLNKKNISISDFPIDQERLSNLIIMFDKGMLSNTNAKKIFSMMLESDKRTPTEIGEEEKMVIIEDVSYSDKVIDSVLKNNKEEFERLKNGEIKLISYFIGLIMKESKGTVDPSSLKSKLEEIAKK